MTLPALLPALVTRLKTISSLGSVTASANLENAQRQDHDQTISPRALVFIAELQANHSTPMLNAHQMQLTWVFDILLTLQAPHRFGQSQVNQLEQLQLAIITSLIGFQLHDQVTPLVFIKARHQQTIPHESWPDKVEDYNTINIQGNWHNILQFQTHKQYSIPSTSGAF